MALLKVSDWRFISNCIPWALTDSSDIANSPNSACNQETIIGMASKGLRAISYQDTQKV
jgi:hypothetical protein